MKKTPKTQEEIVAEIAALIAIRDKVVEYSFFGNNNREAIDAQIEVLADELDHDAVWDKYPDLERDMEIRDAALQALYWREGDENFDSEADSLSEEWKSLIE